MPAVHHIKRLLGAATVAATLLLGASANATPAAAASLPTQGIFAGCPLDSASAACTQRLSLIHAAGLQVVVTAVNGASLGALSQYAAAAQGLGMSVMWEISDPSWWQQPASGTGAASSFPAFASACGCSNNGDLLSYMAHWLGALPGTYGYYAADDSMLSAGDQAGVSAYTARIKQADPNHTVLIGAANTNQAAQYEQSADMVGQEVYPVTTSPLLPQSANQSTWDSVAATAQVNQRAADQAGKGSAVIMQAFTWGDNVDDGSAIGVCNSSDTTSSCAAKLRYPSGAEQLALRNTVLKNSHPKLMLWYSFDGTYGPVTQDSYFAPISQAEGAARWSGLTAAIQAPPPGSATTASLRVGAHAATHAPRHHKRRKHVARHHKKHKKHKAHKRHRKHG